MPYRTVTTTRTFNKKRNSRNFGQLLMKASDLFLAGTTTVTPASEFDSQTLAVLRGRLVRYLMRSREVSLI